MASSSGSSYTSSQETTNFARMCRIVVDVLRDIIWQVLITEIPAADLPRMVQMNQNKLGNLDGKIHKWLCGLSSSSQIPTAEQFDISSLYTLIRNLCRHVPLPSRKWGQTPDPRGTNLGDDIERIREFRNSLYGHATQAKIDTADFNNLCTEIKSVVSRFDGHFSRKAMKCDFESEIDIVLKCSMDKSLQNTYIDKMREIAILSDDVENVKQKVCNVEQKFGDVEQKVGIAEQKVGDVEQEIGNVEKKIGKVEHTVGNVEQKLGNVDQKVGNVEQKVDNVEQEVCDLEQKVGHVEKKVENVEQQVGDAKQKIVNVEQKTGVVERKVDDVEQQLGDVRQIVGNVEQNVGDVNQKIVNVEQTVCVVEQKVGDVEQKLRNMEQQGGDFKQKIVNVEQKVGDVEQNVGNIEQQVGDVNQKIGNVEQKVGVVEQKVCVVEQKVGDVEQKFGNVEQQVGDVGQKVEAVKQNIVNVEQNVGDMEQKLRVLQQQFEQRVMEQDGDEKAQLKKECMENAVTFCIAGIKETLQMKSDVVENGLIAVWKLRTDYINAAWQSIEGYLLEELTPKTILLSLKECGIFVAEEYEQIRRLKRRRQIAGKIISRISEKLPEAFFSLLYVLIKTNDEEKVAELINIISREQNPEINGNEQNQMQPSGNEQNQMQPSVPASSSYTLRVIALKDGCPIKEVDIAVAEDLKNLPTIFIYDMHSRVKKIDFNCITIHLQLLSKYAQDTLRFFCMHGGMEKFVLDLLKKKDIFSSLPEGTICIQVQVRYDENSTTEDGNGEDFTHMTEELSNSLESFEVLKPEVIKQNLLFQFGYILEEIEPLEFQETFVDKGIWDKHFFDQLKSIKGRRARAVHFLNEVLYQDSSSLLTLVDALKNNGNLDLASRLCFVEKQSQASKDRVDDSSLEVVSVATETGNEGNLWSCQMEVYRAKHVDDGEDDRSLVVGPDVAEMRDEDLWSCHLEVSIGKNVDVEDDRVPEVLGSDERKYPISDKVAQIESLLEPRSEVGVGDDRIPEVPASDERSYPIREEVAQMEHLIEPRSELGVGEDRAPEVPASDERSYPIREEDTEMEHLIKPRSEVGVGDDRAPEVSASDERSYPIREEDTQMEHLMEPRLEVGVGEDRAAEVPASVERSEPIREEVPQMEHLIERRWEVGVWFRIGFIVVLAVAFVSSYSSKIFGLVVGWLGWLVWNYVDWYDLQDWFHRWLEDWRFDTSLPPSIPDNKVTERQLGRISMKLGHVNYSRIGLELGLSEADIQEIEKNYLDTITQCLMILFKWKQQCGDKATFGNLEKAFKNVDIDVNILKTVNAAADRIYRLPTGILDKQPEDKDLRRICSRIVTRHVLLGVELNVPLSTINQIQTKHPRNVHMQSLEIMREWRHSQRRKATFRNLEQAFKCIDIDTNILNQSVNN